MFDLWSFMCCMQYCYPWLPLALTGILVASCISLSFCLSIHPEWPSYCSNSLRISDIGLKFGGVMYSTIMLFKMAMLSHFFFAYLGAYIFLHFTNVGRRRVLFSEHLVLYWSVSLWTSVVIRCIFLTMYRIVPRYICCLNLSHKHHKMNELYMKLTAVH